MQILCACGANPQPLPAEVAAATDAGVDADAQAAADIPWHAGVARLDLPAVTTGTNGRSAKIPFQLPETATSFVLTLQGPATWQLTLATLTAPDGTIVVPEGWADGLHPLRLCVPCVNRIATSAAEASFLVPDAPGVTVAPGTWTFSAQAYEIDAKSLQAQPRAGALLARLDLLRRTGTAPRHGVLDLNLCLTGAHGITADVALQHPRIQTALDTVRNLYAPAGIELGAVRAFNVKSVSLSVIHDAFADGDLTALLQTGVDLPMGINVFLVDAIFAGDPSAMAAVRGLTGSIPGPPLEVGGPRAGVVVSLQLQAGEADLLGRVMAHELGHFLGLFHSTEQAVPGEPPLQDTLPDSKDGDPDNLMYWAQTETGQGALSPQQVQVLFANPWLRDKP